MMAAMHPTASPAIGQVISGVSRAPRLGRLLALLALACVAGWTAPRAAVADEPKPAAKTSDVPSFEKDVLPILENYCFDCHADGINKGNVILDAPANDALLHNHDLWLKVLKNVRADIMPPAKKDRPNADELNTLAKWVKYGAFGINPADPDPGRVTLRRLNRVEYRNTVRELTGVDFRTDEEFPPDDTGYGFDNIGDVLTVSPLLLEKYMQAAEKIVSEAVPLVPRVVREGAIPGNRFRRD